MRKHFQASFLSNRPSGHERSSRGLQSYFAFRYLAGDGRTVPSIMHPGVVGSNPTGARKGTPWSSGQLTGHRKPVRQTSLRFASCRDGRRVPSVLKTQHPPHISGYYRPMGKPGIPSPLGGEDRAFKSLWADHLQIPMNSTA